MRADRETRTRRILDWESPSLSLHFFAWSF